MSEESPSILSILLERWLLPAMIAAGLALCTFSRWPADMGVSLCAFRTMTGHPCPGCGMARGMVAMGHGEWWRAWTLNPLAPLFYLGAVGYLAWAVTIQLSPAARRWAERNHRWRTPILISLAALAAALYGLSVYRFFVHGGV